jgi:uncharacterized protein (TIGR02145 family)
MKVYKVNEHLFEKSNKFIGEKEVDWMRYVTLQQGTGGSISANTLSGRKGTIVNLSQTTNTDYRFDGYSITGANLSSNKFAINDSDVTAQGIFTYYPKRSVTVTQQTGGTVVANPTTGHDGDTVTLSNTANKGYTFNNYSITGATLTGSQFKFNGYNVSVKPNYTHNVYNLTLQTDGHGKLVAGKTTGYYQDTTTLTTTPSSNYEFSAFKVTGGTINNNVFTWSNTTNATAKAFFASAIPTTGGLTIGNQIWMAKNLNYNDGGSGISTALLSNVNGVNMGVQYFYTYDAAVRVASKIKGWHLPTSAEWEQLYDYADPNPGIYNKAAMKLKSENGWYQDYGGIDSYGFCALPAGDGDGGGGYPGYVALFWTITTSTNSRSIGTSMSYRYTYPSTAEYSKDRQFTVRLVKD